ncbi:restriction endonuclease subunit S [Rhizobium sp. CFBP 8762]|uniref:restriction endonuclease subunit S n=1 Tax=Rhizobium sp. CFBP 8762 TaxID=2775279 RepID=UPI00177ECC53|nr:restriction endonuclease subunit S [Rhizobium sp. CFBP 8762]MBD8556855.1 restriction endonuclease subunit S [Rhizobium sp. CFBP 8762]
MSREVPSGWSESQIDAVADMNPESLRSNTSVDFRLKYIDVATVDGPSSMLEPRPMNFGEAPSRARKRVKRGDILVSTIRPYLRSFCQVLAREPDLVASTAFAVLRPKPPVDGDFLYQHVLSEKFVEHLTPRMKGSNYPAVTASDVGAYPFLLPPLHEQRRIAEILSSVDEAIATTRAVIEQTRKVKQGVLERLLTKGIGHTRFKQTEIGEIPEGWPLTSADNVCTQVSVGIVIKPSQYYVEKGVRCFRSANVREGFVEDADWVYISEEGNRVNQKSVLRTGDVLVVRTGYPGTSCVVPPRYDGANCIDIIFARPKIELIDPYFLSTFINSASGKTQVLKAEGGLAQKHFNVGAMKQMQFPLPPLNEQHEIVANIQEFASTEAALERTLEQQIRSKSALMSDLLTGRKRVTDALPMAAE